MALHSYDLLLQNPYNSFDYIEIISKTTTEGCYMKYLTNKSHQRKKGLRNCHSLRHNG